MVKFWAQKVDGRLIPDGNEARDAFDQIPSDKYLQVDIRLPRNSKHSRLYWKLCARIGSGIGKSAEWVSDALKIETGNFSVYRYGGKEHLVLGSISFEKFDQQQFDAYWKECLEVIFRVWGIEADSLKDLLEKDKK